MGGSLSHFWCLACWVVEFNYKCPFNIGWQRLKWPFQVLFRCWRPLNRGVHLIKVSFKVTKGNKFGDFGYCLLNRGCLLNTVSAWYRFHCICLSKSNVCLTERQLKGEREGRTNFRCPARCPSYRGVRQERVDSKTILKANILFYKGQNSMPFVDLRDLCYTWNLVWHHYPLRADILFQVH